MDETVETMGRGLEVTCSNSLRVWKKARDAHS